MAAATQAPHTAGRRGAEVVQAGERRLARVESLRALAALAVALGHAWGLGHDYGATAQDTYIGRVVFGGGFGVFLFFALSGYLLFWPFARRAFGGGAAIDLRRYAVNRALRILPLYWVSVIVVLAFLHDGGGSFGEWWRFMLLAQNFEGWTVGQVNGVLWSLVVEVHFYVLLPFLALGLAAVARGSLRRAALALGALGAVSLALWIAFVEVPESANPLWRYNLPATFFYFIPGMLLALLRLRWEEERPAWLSGRAASSGTWLAASALIWLVVFSNYDLAALAALAGFFAVGAAVLPLDDGRLRRALDWRPLAALGVASYSLYVWHAKLQDELFALDGFPSSTAAIIAITMPLSIGVAFLSYRLVEAPFLRLRRRWSSASAPMTEPHDAPRRAR